MKTKAKILSKGGISYEEFTTMVAEEVDNIKEQAAAGTIKTTWLTMGTADLLCVIEWQEQD